MKNILIPVDFSDNAYNALLYGCALAKEINAEIILIHCYQIPLGQGTVMIDFLDILEKDSMQGLNKFLNRVQSETEYFDIEIKTHSYNGFLTEGIDELIIKYEPVMIVMGTTGGSNFSKRFFGSNTSAVIKRVDIPVLAIPSGAKWQGWNHTLLATDFIPVKTGSCYQRLKKLTNGMPVHVEILHVITPEEKQEDFSKLESQMIDSVKTENLEFHYQPGESVVDGILHYTKEHPCDVIVMLKRKHGFLEQLFVESATRKMSLHTKNPILILQE